MEDLYSLNSKGEVAFCALAAINAKTDGATDSGHIQFQTQKLLKLN